MSAPPLVTAARVGDLETVKSLISQGADVNAATPGQGVTALMAACYENRPECVLVLLGHSAVRDRVDTDGRAAIHWAAASWRDDPACVSLLTDAGFGALVNSVTGRGNGSTLHTHTHTHTHSTKSDTSPHAHTHR